MSKKRFGRLMAVFYAAALLAALAVRTVGWLGLRQCRTADLEVMQAVEEERLADCPVEFYDKHACCVVLASEGYPQKYKTGFPITVDDGFTGRLYCAGVKRSADNIPVTAGGRVLGVAAVGDTLRQAVDEAYRQAAKVHFENAYCRKDIGRRALAAGEEN